LRTGEVGRQSARDDALYGTHRADIRQFKSDLGSLFKLLEEGKIKPIIMKKFPILEPAK
jgi:NADPH:quinone reductase-like Zn-dependent oxidoreductase